MSTLWTPRGEVHVEKESPLSASGPTAPLGTAATAQSGPVDPLTEAETADLDDLSPEERARAEQAIRELAESRERLLEVPASIVVANHAMGLYELAALHLANRPPNFAEAAVAIDALKALLDGMAGRLGEPEPTLRDGLSQIRMAFVKLKQAATTETTANAHDTANTTNTSEDTLNTANISD